MQGDLGAGWADDNQGGVSPSPLDALTPARLLTPRHVLEGMEKDGQLEIEGKVVEGESAAG